MIELRHVYKSFKNNPVLEDVNGMFEPGIVYCLTGRNGSGKSVLMKLICELLLPDQGEILLPKDPAKYEAFMEHMDEALDIVDIDPKLQFEHVKEDNEKSE